ncbi:SDR family oxidoreductase, partial [Thermodesulfobacteriota bacterium]
MILYIGATGRLGTAAVRELQKRNLILRCLVRASSDTTLLQGAGIELVRGDVRDEASIEKALQGVTTVISSFATNIARDRAVESLWKTDYEGNLSLIRLAKKAGVKKFIFVSYWGLAKFGGFEHGKIKKMVEDLLRVSGLDYTVFRVTTLASDMSLLLGSSLKKRGWSPILMKPHEKVRPILLEDLAWCLADATENRAASNKIVEVAGEEEYTFLELRDLFSRTIGKKIRF